MLPHGSLTASNSSQSLEELSAPGERPWSHPLPAVRWPSRSVASTSPAQTELCTPRRSLSRSSVPSARRLALAPHAPQDCDTEYGKPGQQSAVPTPVHQLVAPTLTSLWRRAETGGQGVDSLSDSLLLKLAFPPELHRDYGAPQAAELLLRFPRNTTGGREVVQIELTLLNKSATRLGEAAFLTFNPSVSGALAGSWWMDKIGEWVSPLEVVDGGSKGLHGVSSGVRYNASMCSSTATMMIASLDAGLVVWGPPDPFPSPIHEDPDMSEGASYMLWNNIWNTNCERLEPPTRAHALSPASTEIEDCCQAEGRTIEPPSSSDINWYPFEREDANLLFRFEMSLS